MDGTFSQAKQQLCIMAATERCSAYFTQNQSSSTTFLGSYYHSKRRSPLALGGHKTESVLVSNNMSATGKLRPSSWLVRSPVWTLVGCNTVAWASVYVLCVAATKARARRLSRARRASDTGNLVGVDAGDAGAEVAAGRGAGNAGVDRSSADNAPNVEMSQQAPMASGSLQLVALSPGFVSPPNRRSAKHAGSTAAAQARSNLPCPPSSSSLSESKDMVRPNSNMMSPEETGKVCGRSSPTISSGGAKSTRGEKPLDNRGEREKGLASPAPASRLPRSSSAPSALTLLETKALGEGNRKEVDASENLVSSNKASNCLGMRFSEAERELGKMIGAGQPNNFAPAIPWVANLEVASTHESAPASGSPGSASSASDGPGFQSRASAAASVSNSSGSDAQVATHASFLDTPSTASTTYSARRDKNVEGCTKSTSLHDMPSRESDVVSAGWGDSAAQGTDVINAGTRDVARSSIEILESRTGDSTKDNLGPRTSWVAPHKGSPIGLNIGRPGVGAIQSTGFDATRSLPSGIYGIVEKAKGPFAYEISRSGKNRELETHPYLDDIGEDAAEEKGASSDEVSSPGVERELGVYPCSGVIEGGVIEGEGALAYQVSSVVEEPQLQVHPRSDVIGDGVVEAKGPFSYQIPCSGKNIVLETHARSEGVGEGVAEAKESSAYRIPSAEKGQEPEDHAHSNGIGRGAAGQSGASAHQMSTADKELELKMVLGLVKSSTKAHLTAGSEGLRSSTSPRVPRWGNMSTDVPLEERHRRNQELFEAVQRPRETVTEEEEQDRGEAQPADFPDESSWPSGDGYAEWEGLGDRLPPPSDYEVQEAAEIMEVYNKALRDLGLEP